MRVSLRRQRSRVNVHEYHPRVGGPGTSDETSGAEASRKPAAVQLRSLVFDRPRSAVIETFRLPAPESGRPPTPGRFFWTRRPADVC